MKFLYIIATFICGCAPGTFQNIFGPDARLEAEDNQLVLAYEAQEFVERMDLYIVDRDSERFYWPRDPSESVWGTGNGVLQIVHTMDGIMEGDTLYWAVDLWRDDDIAYSVNWADEPENDYGEWGIHGAWYEGWELDWSVVEDHPETDRPLIRVTVPCDACATDPW